MKNCLMSIFWIALTIIFSGCTKNSVNFKDFQVPSISIPYLSKFKVDKTLPTVQKLRYRASMSEVVLEWDRVKSNQIAGYRILRYYPKDKEYKVLDTVQDSVATHYVDSGLRPNSVYTYRVSCFTKDGRVSLASNPVVAKTIYDLSPIKDLKAISNLPKRIKISWKLYKQADLIDFYSIQRSPNGTTEWQELAKLNDSLAVEYIDYNIKDAKTYYYKVIGYTHDNIPTPSSNIVFAHSKPLPLPPTNITATQNEPRKIKVAWFDTNKYNKIVQYNIYTSILKDTMFTKHASTPNMFYIDKVDGDGKVVYYKITAVDEDGLESPLPNKAAKAMSKPNPSAPEITEYKIVDNRVIIKWAPPARDVRQYTVIKKYFNSFFIPKTLKITGFTSRTFVDKDIKLGKTYRYQVIGIDSDGIPTKPSREISITIK